MKNAIQQLVILSLALILHFKNPDGCLRDRFLGGRWGNFGGYHGCLRGCKRRWKGWCGRWFRGGGDLGGNGKVGCDDGPDRRCRSPGGVKSLRGKHGGFVLVFGGEHGDGGGGRRDSTGIGRDSDIGAPVFVLVAHGLSFGRAGSTKVIAAHIPIALF
eukprot:scaffold421304_cov54-Attheya_sp.AAC.2